MTNLEKLKQIVQEFNEMYATTENLESDMQEKLREAQKHLTDLLWWVERDLTYGKALSDLMFREQSEK